MRNGEMLIPIFGSVLCGAILGRYFEFLVLIFAYVLTILIILVNPTNVPYSLVGILLEIVVLFTGLQFGYIAGLITRRRERLRSFRTIASLHRRSGAKMFLRRPGQ